MGRHLAETPINTRSARRPLAPQPRPYWRALEPGLHLGYRKTAAGAWWVVRWGRNATDYRQASLGRADDDQAADDTGVLTYQQAVAKARTVAAGGMTVVVEAAAPVAPYTVGDALRDYLAWADEHTKAADDARQRADAEIMPALGQIACADLTSRQISLWLTTLASTGRRLRTRDGEDIKRAPPPTSADEIRARRSTANRTLTILKAALNRAWRAGAIASDAAWRQVEPYDGVDSARVRYLTIAECQRLLAACEPDFGDLVNAALQTGARYGELGALTVGDFNDDVGAVHVRDSKSGHGRHIILTEEGRALFRRLVTGRPAGAPILVRSDGRLWEKGFQIRPMARACADAMITPEISFHILRHTWASLAIMAGVPMLVVAGNLGHADTRMIERHYGHLAHSYRVAAIREMAPRYSD